MATPIDKTLEQKLSTDVQEKREVLTLLLPPRFRKTVKADGSEEPKTIEDHARFYAKRLRDNGNEWRASRIEVALTEYQAAVNAFWTYALEAGIDESLFLLWRRMHDATQRYDSDDIRAEIVVQLRAEIARFKPGGKASLLTYARRGVFRHLNLWEAQQGPVQIPEKVARTTEGKPRNYRVPIRAIEDVDKRQWMFEQYGGIKDGETLKKPSEAEHAAHAHIVTNPWDAIDEALDAGWTVDQLVEKGLI